MGTGVETATARVVTVNVALVAPGSYSGGSRVTADEGDDGATSRSWTTERRHARGGGPANDAGWIQHERAESGRGRHRE
jgi:hypothetical protein